jgi:hypothetical protein
MRKLVLLVSAAALVIAACGGDDSTGSAAPPTHATTVSIAPTTTPATTTTSAPTPLEVVQQYIDAFNRGDGVAAAAVFAPDARLDTTVGGCTPCVGRDVIESHFVSAAGSGAKIGISDPTVTGDTLVATGSLTSPNFPPGIERAINTFTAKVRDGLIVEASVVYDANDPQTATLLQAAG